MDKNLTGHIFGRLTVKGLAGYVAEASGEQGSIWKCACACGTVKNVKRKYLISGETKSCGCLHKEVLTARNTTHGESKTITYMRWQSMHRRVKDAKNEKNKCYAGKDICTEWYSYENFIRDMGACPKGYSLDRIDNSKGYCPANCRWVPLCRQAANTSRNAFTEINGVIATISDHARANGIKPDVAFDRINKLGWDVADAVSIPTMKVGGKRREL